MPSQACGPSASCGTWYEQAGASWSSFKRPGPPLSERDPVGRKLAVGGQRGLATLTREDLALADPHLAADLAVGGLRLGEAQAARAGHADALGAELHGGLEGLLHGAAEGDAALELGGDVLGHQLRVGLGLADLDDVEEDLVLGELLQVLLHGLDARAALADDDARPSGVHVDLHLVGRALDLHLGDARVVERLLHELADPDVLMEPLRVVLVLEPLGVPGLDDPEAEPDRMNFLAQRASPSEVVT